MKKVILAAVTGFAIATAVFFFVPSAQDASAQSSRWGNPVYASCIMDNLKEMKTDRAINLLVEYCSSRT